MNLKKQKRNVYLLDLQRIARRFDEDKISVYAAQASFFVILSVMPFLSLLVSIISFFTPADIQSIFDRYTFSEDIMDILGTLFTDLKTAPKISLLSFSAIITLWSASRGTSAIRRGIETIYGSNSSRGFLFHRLKSLIGTLVLIVLIVATVILLLFGDSISNLIGNIRFTDIIMSWRTPFLVLYMCIVFTIIYTSAARRSVHISSTIRSQIPGAILSSVGWVLFSYLYSLYIKFFPNASYIYGSLAAVCLMMLWLYFCMIILLLGAELNKFYPSLRKNNL